MLRSIRFALHVPAGKLLARGRLMTKRKALSLARRLRLIDTTGLERASPPTAEEPPVALFLPKDAAEHGSDGRLSFTFLNHREEFVGPIDWRRRINEPGGQLWSMNLHYMQYLPKLDDQKFEDIVSDWILKNTPYKNEYWKFDWNSYTLSIRVVMLMAEAGRRRARLSPNFTQLLHRSIANQLYFLERNMETDIGGNHIIKNIKALIWSSAFFGGPAASRWGGLGRAALERELRSQILPDGMHYERSTSYHSQVFSDLLEMRAILGPGALKGALDDALLRMSRPLVDLSHPDGGPALFNDAGLNMATPPGEALSAYDRLLGTATTRRKVFAYRDAGYFGRHDEAWYLATDFGPVGPDDLPAHSHGDIGSFELSVAGRRLIVDPGVYEYIPGERRARSRSAASHNVLHIEGGDQAEFFGSFRCGRRPAVAASFQATDDGFELSGTHDGYARGPGGLIHHRIRVGRRSFRIDDRIEGHRTGNASIGLLLHPAATPERSGDAIAVANEGARIVLRADLPLAIEQATHWPDMGVEQVTRRLVVSLPAKANSVSLEIDIEKA